MKFYLFNIVKMSFDPTYPSKILILDSNRKIKGNTTNFTCQLDKSYVNSEGNFYCKVLDIMIDHESVDGTDKYFAAGLPDYIDGIVGVKSNLSMSNTFVGTISVDNTVSNLNGLIGYGTVVTEDHTEEGAINIGDARGYFSKTLKSTNNSWVQCKSPNGMIDITIVDGNGEQIPLSKSYDGYPEPTTRIQTIKNVIVVVEVKQVNALQETMHQIKARRNYQLP